MSADEIAKRIGISRTAVYRFEKGEVVKIETLASLAELLGVSLATLLGIEIEYISSAVTYFERLRQLEEAADRIIVLAGPISFLVGSPEFRNQLSDLLRESVESEDGRREKSLQDVERILEILDERRKNYERRKPAIVNLMAALDIERLLRSGFVGRPLIAEEEVRVRQQHARAEIEHFAHLMEAEPIGIQIGLVTGTLPHTGFQIFRSGDRKTLSISPFRLGEQPNIRLGVAMITENHEAVSLHEAVVDEMWRTALKGREAAAYLRSMIASIYG
ncbi:MAG: helix-turn-helix transcriptional regulator [Rhizobiales bacterium]|nr:helix-turn-helix transcriptional regulator [Hyphomicrobiales bacterium]